MAAIREINLGVSQLEEVVQTNAAASHELSATADGLASQASTLQELVEFFQIDTSGSNGQMGRRWNRFCRALALWGGWASAVHTRQAALSSTAPADLTRRGRTDCTGCGLLRPYPARRRQFPGTTETLERPRRGASSNSGGTTPRGGVIVSLDNDDDNFERFS